MTEQSLYETVTPLCRASPDVPEKYVSDLSGAASDAALPRLPARPNPHLI